MTSVLFVCAGNICRSPTAEGVFRAKAAALGFEAHADSAGTGGWHVGDPPDARSIEHAARRGYDLAPLRARQAVTADFDRFTHMLAMDSANLSGLIRLRARAGDSGPFPRLLLDYAEIAHGREVPDPYYGGPEGFERVLDLVEAGVEGLLAELAG